MTTIEIKIQMLETAYLQTSFEAAAKKIENSKKTVLKLDSLIIGIVIISTFIFISLF